MNRGGDTPSGTKPLQLLTNRDCWLALPMLAKHVKYAYKCYGTCSRVDADNIGVVEIDFEIGVKQIQGNGVNSKNEMDSLGTHLRYLDRIITDGKVNTGRISINNILLLSTYLTPLLASAAFAWQQTVSPQADMTPERNRRIMSCPEKTGRVPNPTLQKQVNKRVKREKKERKKKKRQTVNLHRQVSAHHLISLEPSYDCDIQAEKIRERRKRTSVESLKSYQSHDKSDKQKKKRKEKEGQ